MATSLLVLGGTGFAGRAAVLEGLARGWSVTTFNRGRAEEADADVEHIAGDRLEPRSLAPLAEREWDVVLDPWSGAPRAVRDSAGLLAPRAGHYVYISSESVYAPPPPMGADEKAPSVEASPDADGGDYAQCKRGAELAVLGAFGERSLLARAGLILGPHEDVGRLTWWLTRAATGGEILAPGPRDLPLQYVDVRDLAAFVLDGALAGRAGAFNLVSRRGYATMSSMLEACLAVAGAEGARLTWVAPDAIAQAGIEPWTELPLWLPPDHEFAGMHASNVERAHAAGLRCRPTIETVRDTWVWLSALDGPAPLRAGLEPAGLDPGRERAALRAWHARA